MIVFQNMPLYSLIVSIALVVLWGVWRITGLRRHTHWRVNRFVLVLIPVVSLIIGLIPFMLPNEGVSTMVEFSPVVSTVSGNVEVAPLNVEGGGGTYPVYRNILSYALIIYWIGFSVSLIAMLIGLCQVIYIVMTSKACAGNPHLRISNKKNLMPFSWGRWIIMPEGDDYPESDAVVVTHEQAHLSGRHWLDLILINIVKAVTWYCPVTYAIAHDMAENHEFEADNSVIRAGYNPSDYQLLLVEKAARRRFANSVVCGINNPYSLIKTRILMMQKKKSSRSVTLRALGFIPVAMLLAVAATSPVLAAYVQKDSESTDVVNTVKVTEAAIMLTDKELMEPRPEEITLPVADKNVISKWVRTLIYPSNLAAEGKQGRVLLKAKVNTAGEMTDISVFKTSGFKDFDDAAIKTVTGTTGLTPATYKGNNADIDVLIPITFKKQSGPELPAIEGNSGFMLDEIVAMTF